MEVRGAVNCYMPYKSYGTPIYTINLACGTTPFMLVEDGKEFSSSCYRMPKGVQAIAVDQGWYRPQIAEFDSMEKDMQDHVLNGGLLHKPLAEAVNRQLPSDSVDTTWEYEQFQEWVGGIYGRRLKPVSR